MNKITLLAAIFVTSLTANAQILYDQGYDDLTNLPDELEVNASDIPNATFFQGNPAVFPAYDGDPNAYLAMDWVATSGTVLDLWGIGPALDLQNGDIYTFYTRTIEGSAFPDRLEVHIDPDGSGALPTFGDVGSYTELLLSINPDLEVGGYPEEWTLFTVIISGLPTGLTSTRMAIRYWATDAGPTGVNSNYIGFDRSVIERVLSVEDIAIEGLKAYPNPTTNILNVEAVSTISSVEVLNVLGQRLYSETATTNNIQIDLSAFQTGTYFVRITADDTSNVLQIIKQ